MRTWIEINKKNLIHNLTEIKGLIGEGVKLMSVVKANAYGHGLLQIASIANDYADWFGVDSIKEAIKLRESGIKKDILILGYTVCLLHGF